MITYEQHQELLELAKYFAKARRKTLQQGFQLDSLTAPSFDKEEEREVVYVERNEIKTNRKKNLL
jgi:hypothetical protein